jgi:voltage-gated potassium channel
MRSFALPLLIVLGIFVAGTSGYFALGAGAWSLSDCAYMTATTISTVGFREVVPVGDDPILRTYTIVLIFLGAGSMLYLLSTVTAFLVEGNLNEIIRRRRMEKAMEGMRDHYLVCGVGRNGEFAAAQLVSAGYAVVVIDRSEEAIQGFRKVHGMDLPYVVGDTTRDEDVLLRAGVQRARGLIAALPEDEDNVFLILSAKELNPRLHVVSKVNDQRSIKKLTQVGADHVVSPSAMGGYRMFLQMIRPNVTDFVDYLLLEKGEGLVFDEVPIPAGSSLHGRRLADSEIRKRTNLLVVGIRDEANATFTYNPGPDVALAAGTRLIVLGPRESVRVLREMAG